MMKLSKEARFRLAVKSAMFAGLAAGTCGGAQAQQEPAAPATPAPAGTPIELDTVEVTGSRLRRVDTETASPLFTIDRATIESSGVTTLGELVQELPAISGAATNPQVNNGGGTGAAVISLRGLGEERTLVLLNGRRLGPSFDINSIPVNLIERVEVLKEGAGAIWGSDAVGGVVNFITRKGYVGAELAVQAGESSEDDGKSLTVEGTWGVSTERANMLLGLNYNRQDAISAANRDFSRNALYLYNYYGTDTVLVLGSSRNPRGRISLPADHPLRVALGGCSSVTRIPGTAGDSATADDYRCYSGAADSFDYQPFNLIVTPQERGTVFTLADYDISKSVEIFTELFHNFTQSGFTIAPLPFDGRSDNVVISSESVFNPFGIDFGGSSDNPSDPLNPNFLTRFVTNGNRFSEVETTTDQITAGLRGPIGSTTWNWDAAVTYQRINQHTSVSGYTLQTNLQQAVGPSFDTDPAPGIQSPVCGTPGPDADDPTTGATIIPNCTPINIFNTDDPATVAALGNITSGYENQTVATFKTFEATFNGNLFSWKPGTALAAAGFLYRDERLAADVDALTEAPPPEFSNCLLSGETCSGDTRGTDELWEVFGEVFLPLLADMPAAEALNLTVGLRYSDYESFGSTENFSVKLEYRPIDDLLARVSFSEVFRAPTIFDRFGAPASSNPLFFDPCVGLTAADVAANPNLALACENVPTDGTFAGAPTQQIDQLIASNPDLDPETGEVLTYGLVYSPGFLPDFSTTVDFWTYEIDDAIIAPDVNTIGATCVETGDPTVCGLIIRFSDGQVDRILSPTFNSATFETSGVDIGFKYNKRNSPIGMIRASVDVTHTMEFKYKILPNSQEVDAAGTYDAQFGNYAEWRATGNLWWSMMGIEAGWTTRWIDGVDIAASFGQGSGRPAASGPLEVGSRIYHDLAAGYTYEPTKTSLLFGIENLFDKQPPLYYQYALNANTNVETYDAIGRYFFVRLSQSF